MAQLVWDEILKTTIPKSEYNSRKPTLDKVVEDNVLKPRVAKKPRINKTETAK